MFDKKTGVPPKEFIWLQEVIYSGQSIFTLAHLREFVKSSYEKTHLVGMSL